MSHFSKQSYAQQLAQRLSELIGEGTWPVGMKLPAIRKVAADYQVSVTTAHGALRQLETDGLIDRRPSGAAYIKHPGTAATVHEPTAPAVDEPHASHIAMIGSIGPGPVPDRDDWGLRILMAAEAELFKSGVFHLTRVGSVQPDKERYIQELISQLRRLGPNLAGALLFGANDGAFYTSMSKELSRLDLPWVSINQPDGRVAHNFVSADNFAVGQVAGRCFTLLGYRRILFINAGLERAWSCRQKAGGLIDAYLRADQPISGFEHLRCRSTREPDGYEAMRAYLRRAAPPEAIFAIGDLLALGAIRACREAGLDVPGQVAVMGSTGLEAAQLATPSLTVVTQPMEAMGRQAARRLLAMIRGGKRRIPGCRIAGRLIVRDSLPLPDAVRQTLVAEGLLRDKPTERRRARRRATVMLVE